MGQLRMSAEVSYSDHLYTRAIGTPSPGLFIAGKIFRGLLDELAFENLSPELRNLRTDKRRRDDICPATNFKVQSTESSNEVKRAARMRVLCT